MTPFDSTKITSIIIPNGPTYLNGNFMDLKTLITASIPDSVTELHFKTFSGCSSLKTISIGNGLKSLGSNIFSGCYNLETFNFGGLRNPSFDETTFEGCNRLKKVNVPFFYLNDNFCNFPIVKNDYAICNCGDDAQFEINKTSGIFRLFGNSDTNNYLYSYEYGHSNFPIYSEYTSLFNTIIIEEGIKSIGDYFFYQFTNVLSVKIPNSVTVIGSYAFCECEKLCSVTFGDNIQKIYTSAFNGCSYLQSIVIPNKVINISDYCFYECNSLKSVILHENIQVIGKKAFAKSGLESIVIPEKTKIIGKYSFESCTNIVSVTIGKIDEVKTNEENDAYTIIENCAFEHLSNLITLKIGSNVKSLENGAFCECSMLKSVHLPDSIKTIDNNIFSDCFKLESISIPDGVESLGDGAFDGCESLTSVIAKKIHIIGPRTFFYCKELTFLTLNENIESIGDHAFDNCHKLSSFNFGKNLSYLGNYAFSECKTLSSIEFPKITFIGNYTFYNCSNLKSIVLGDVLSSIGDHAFYLCSQLSSVSLPLGLTKICDYAFKYTSIGPSLIIPKKVLYIGESCFSNCYNIISVIIGEENSNRISVKDEVESLTSIGIKAFDFCNNITSVIIGENVGSIDDTSFNGCNKIKSFVVNEKNPMFSTYDGLVYNKLYTTLKLIPMAKTGVFKLHDNLSYIEDYQFERMPGILSVQFGKKLYRISPCAFTNCLNLTAVVIPENIGSIGPGAFYECSQLSVVNFTGKKAPYFESDNIFEGCDKLKTINVPYDYEGDKFGDFPITRSVFIQEPNENENNNSSNTQLPSIFTQYPNIPIPTQDPGRQMPTQDPGKPIPTQDPNSTISHGDNETSITNNTTTNTYKKSSSSHKSNYNFNETSAKALGDFKIGIAYLGTSPNIVISLNLFSSMMKKVRQVFGHLIPASDFIHTAIWVSKDGEGENDDSIGAIFVYGKYWNEHNLPSYIDRDGAKAFVMTLGEFKQSYPSINPIKLNVHKNMKLFEFIERVKESGRWNARDYNWPTNNCQHFTSELINILKATRENPDHEDWINLPKPVLNSLEINEIFLK